MGEVIEQKYKQLSYTMVPNTSILWHIPFSRYGKKKKKVNKFKFWFPKASETFVNYFSYFSYYCHIII